MRCEADIY